MNRLRKAWRRFVVPGRLTVNEVLAGTKWMGPPQLYVLYKYLEDRLPEEMTR